MIDTNELQVLCALFSLSRGNQPIDAVILADTTTLSPTQIAAALVALGHLGLVDRSRLRLTMAGLAVALRADRGHRSRPAPARARTGYLAERSGSAHTRVDTSRGDAYLAST